MHDLPTILKTGKLHDDTGFKRIQDHSKIRFLNIIKQDAIPKK